MPLNLTPEVMVLEPGIKRQTLVECCVSQRGITKGHIAAHVAAIGKFLLQTSIVG